MFCEKCGTKLLDSAEFCTNCGTSILGGVQQRGTTERVLDTDIQLRVKPSFKYGYMVLPSVIIWLVAILISSFTFGVLNFAVGVITFCVLCFVMLVIVAIKTAINKKQYDNYCYDFYRTKVIYKDSFLNLSEKEVKYKYIREVTMRQTFFQRFFNIGNIILFTNAETGFGNGINIVNIEDVQDVYREIKNIIEV